MLIHQFSLSTFGAQRQCYNLQCVYIIIHRDSLWRILRHYGIPPKIVSIIKLLYGDFRSFAANT